MENLWCAHFLVELTTAAEDYPVKNEETPGVATWGNYEKSMCNLTNNLFLYYLFLMKIV